MFLLGVTIPEGDETTLTTGAKEGRLDTDVLDTGHLLPSTLGGHHGAGYLVGGHGDQPAGPARDHEVFLSSLWKLQYSGVCYTLGGQLLRGVLVVLAVVQDDPVLALDNAGHAAGVRAPAV